MTVRNVRSGAVTRTKANQKDYKAIAASKIIQPSKLPEKPHRILIYARNKKGKTRFSMSPGKGKVLILDPEHGTDPFITRDPHVWHIPQWEELDDAYNYLRTEDHPYTWVALDGLSRINNMALRYVMNQAELHDLNRRPGMVQRQDYYKSGELMKEMLFRFHNLPVGVIYTAHERQVGGAGFSEDEDAEEVPTQYVADLPDGVRSSLNGIVDIIGRLYVVKVDSQKTDRKVLQRRLWVEPSVMYDTGYRSDYVLPQYVINPTAPKLVQLLRQGKASSGESKA